MVTLDRGPYGVVEFIPEMLAMVWGAGLFVDPTAATMQQAVGAGFGAVAGLLCVLMFRIALVHFVSGGADDEHE